MVIRASRAVVRKRALLKRCDSRRVDETKPTRILRNIGLKMAVCKDWGVCNCAKGAAVRIGASRGVGEKGSGGKSCGGIAEQVSTAAFAIGAVAMYRRCGDV